MTLQVRLNHCDPALKFSNPVWVSEGVGLSVVIPKHIPALPSVIFWPLSWPTSALAPWTPFPGAFQIQQKHFCFFLESITKSRMKSEGVKGWH